MRKYKGKAWGQLENTHTEAEHRDYAGILGRGLLRISRSFSAVARGNIGERDDMILGQESARGREATTRAA